MMMAIERALFTEANKSNKKCYSNVSQIQFNLTAILPMQHFTAFKIYSFALV